MAWGRAKPRVRAMAWVRANAGIKDGASVRGRVWIRAMARDTVCWCGNLPRAKTPMAQMVGPFAQLSKHITWRNCSHKTRRLITAVKPFSQLRPENQAPELLP